MGTSRKSASSVTRSAVPMTVTVAARPRDQCVFRITKRTGYSKTSARKMPTKTTRKVSPIAWNAASRRIVAVTISTVRIGSRSSMRRGLPSLIPANSRRRSGRLTQDEVRRVDRTDAVRVEPVRGALLDEAGDEAAEAPELPDGVTLTACDQHTAVRKRVAEVREVRDRVLRVGAACEHEHGCR